MAHFQEGVFPSRRIALKRQEKRPAPTWRDRAWFALLSSKRRTWKQTLMIVQPDALWRWHRPLFRRLAPVSAVSVELARFDTQKLQVPEVNGVGYQQGELFGYELWEYLLHKWGHQCAYCVAEGVPLEREHIVPQSRGGMDRPSNLTVSCRPCNQNKGARTAVEFGHPQVQAQVQQPLKHAAAVNTTRWAIYRARVATSLPLEVGTGGRTKYDRTRLELPKRP